MILKCKMCGGDMQVISTTGICECEYCGSQQTISKVDDEKIISLYNRANKLRISNEFDKAAGIYESIIASNEEEAEAYWGLCLCKYGIEYVDDPGTGKKIPTCHRTSYESIFNDENFELALENADEDSISIYRSEAKEIDRLQKAIISIANEEKPYDVFICYKETDRNGDRTEDSVIGQDIYEALTDKGLKVFFSRITLEDKLGQEYEPYIFSALNTAKVMIAVGTSYENYNSVWVKNEWGRYLQLMKKDKNKVLIPCYKSIDAYDMPEEFKSFQGQDMSKLGAIQDLVRGIEKILKKDSKSVVINTSNTSSVDALLGRGKMALEDKEWDEADNFFEQVLSIEIENVEAYLGKLLVEFRVSNLEELLASKHRINLSGNYKKILRFADDELKNQLENTSLSIEKSIKNEKLKRRYEEANNKLSKASTIEEYREVLSILNEILEYKDAYTKYKECESKIRLIEDEKRARIKRLKKIIISVLLGICLVGVMSLIISLWILPMCRIQMKKAKYSKANGYFNEKQYDSALALYSELEDYEDSVEMCNTILIMTKYDEALAEFENGDYEKAYSMFFELSDYQDAKSKAYEAAMHCAENYYDNGKYEEALLWINKLDASIDAEELKNKVEAKKLIELKQYYDAIDVLKRSAIDFDNNPLVSNIYEAAVAYYNANNYMEAYQLFNNLGEYGNTFDYLEKCKENMFVDINNATVGDLIQLGHYYKCNEWLVLDRNGSKLLVISKHIIAKEQYDNINTWLEVAYMEEAFSELEKTKIKSISLLSLEEKAKYFKNSNDAIATDEQGVKGSWWLNTPGGKYTTSNGGDWDAKKPKINESKRHIAVFINGKTEISGLKDTEEAGIRPVMWIDV